MTYTKHRYVYIVKDKRLDANIAVVTSERSMMNLMHKGGSYEVELWEQNKRLVQVSEYRDKLTLVSQENTREK